jgi:ribosomal 50S subunit-recycling heat shock protein
MKKFWMVWLAVVLVVGLTSLAGAQQKDAPKGAKPGGVVVEVVKWSGTVKAVDLQKKTVTIEGSGGKVATLNAKNARNLDQVKVGDTVKVEFIEELALFVRKADAPPSAMEAQAVELAPKGQKPGGLVAETIQITANVEAIDSKKRTITLKGPEGKVRTFKVDKGVKNFAQIKKGDQIVLRFTEALAITVTKP